MALWIVKVLSRKTIDLGNAHIILREAAEEQRNHLIHEQEEWLRTVLDANRINKREARKHCLLEYHLDLQVHQIDYKLQIHWTVWMKIKRWTRKYKEKRRANHRAKSREL